MLICSLSSAVSHAMQQVLPLVLRMLDASESSKCQAMSVATVYAAVLNAPANPHWLVFKPSTALLFIARTHMSWREFAAIAGSWRGVKPLRMFFTGLLQSLGLESFIASPDFPKCALLSLHSYIVPVLILAAFVEFVSSTAIDRKLLLHSVLVDNRAPRSLFPRR